jgi:hypothetical protein
MTFTELLPDLQKLNSSDKLKAIQFLETKLSKRDFKIYVARGW